MATAVTEIERLEDELIPLRETLLRHPIYERIEGLEQIRSFMQAHVFAVWDFMSLLKAMQRRFCGSTIPWTPPGNPLAARLINEIVLGEESDQTQQGDYGSHFDLYHAAMIDCGADTSRIDAFLDYVREGLPINSALASVAAPEHVQQFVQQTFRTLASGDDCAIASAFLYGREDLLPDVFEQIVHRLNEQSNGELTGFIYYLERHIELDADQHGPLAARLLNELCGVDGRRWESARTAAIAALEARKAMWDGMLQAIDGSTE